IRNISVGAQPAHVNCSTDPRFATHQEVSMKAIRQHARGGPESLRYEDAPKPSPKAREVLVRVRAAGVTPTELLWSTSLTTQAGTPRPLPFIPGHEFSGEVEAL